jgi:hypothetical protein
MFSLPFTRISSCGTVVAIEFKITLHLINKISVKIMANKQHLPMPAISQECSAGFVMRFTMSI